MPMYNLIEYSDNYNKTSGSLYDFSRDEPPTAAANVWTSPSVLAKAKRHEDYKTAAAAAGDLNRDKADVTLIVPFTYLSTFFRSLEIPLINCEIEMLLKWNDHCLVGYQAGAADNAAVDAGAASRFWKMQEI